MSAYIIATISITDRAQYKRYEDGFKASIAGFPGELLVVEEKPHVLEGTWPHTRTVVMRFADEAAAKGWYESPAYQALAALRVDAATTQLVLTRGLR